MSDADCACLPEGRAFPTALDNLACNRYEIAEFTKAARDLGVGYLGVLLRRGPSPRPQHGGGAGPAAPGEQVFARHVTPRLPRHRARDPGGQQTFVKGM